MQEENIKERQIFGKLIRILPSTDNEIYIIVQKDKVTEDFIEFIKGLEKRFGKKDVIITLTELIRGI